MSHWNTEVLNDVPRSIVRIFENCIRHRGREPYGFSEEDISIDEYPRVYNENENDAKINYNGTKFNSSSWIEDILEKTINGC